MTDNEDTQYQDVEEAEENFHRIQAVDGICSYCGKILNDGGDFGIIDKDDVAHSFCSKDCLIRWFEANGFGQVKFWSETHRAKPQGVSDAEYSNILNDDLPWPGEVPCPLCGSKNHDSEYIAYGTGYNERAHKCKDCGWCFTVLTK